MFVYELSVCGFESGCSPEYTSVQDFNKVCWPVIHKML